MTVSFTGLLTTCQAKAVRWSTDENYTRLRCEVDGRLIKGPYTGISPETQKREGRGGRDEGDLLLLNHYSKFRISLTTFSRGVRDKSLFPCMSKSTI